MKTLVIVVHPNLAASRINRRLAEEIEQQDHVTVHRLYEAYPDEQIDIAAEQQLVEQHDRIVLQFPFYWYSSPSLLKKWQDLVLTYGWAYGSEGGKFRGKDLLIAISTGSPETAYAPGGRNHYTLAELLRPFQATSNLIGAHYLTPFSVDGVHQYTDEQLEQSAKEYVRYALDPAISPKNNANAH
ncbi:NAD(P)H-dependent oxidoreductase [Paenibacillus sp. SYP-B3998]|uniref:NAD(P)H-dependent oxidoreductase n=1 Tax=Paenibacillus sp. SYP-B3998 TaxID=2678564 RepID=A0A6G3ZZH3_9BACL|nr:NAD(P)H-dependent oxidoreductase [Paenibacillus sp. SYP-B3998]NEW07500.1 NAD(P)H-dependent oxidoreductase [Paenibacillus sp. SYP-B3998]